MQEIKVNSAQWDGISQEQQQQITVILQKTGLLKDGDTLVASHEAHLREDEKGADWPWCSIACGVAEAAAVAACGALSGPAAGVCIAAAHAAGEVCRSKC